MQRTLLALAVAATAVLALLLFRAPRRPAPEPIATLPDFALFERDGARVAQRDLLGAPWIANFVFTRCVLYCPRLTARMKELRGKLPPGVKTVSFSVDPEHDTPEVLTAYARQWRIEGREWLFLTGAREEVWTLVRNGFLLPVEEAPEVPASPILHSNRFVLVDGRGRIRAAVEAYEEGALERLLADLRAVLAEEAERQ
jgi:protein SCO1/2